MTRATTGSVGIGKVGKMWPRSHWKSDVSSVHPQSDLVCADILVRSGFKGTQ